MPSKKSKLIPIGAGLFILLLLIGLSLGLRTVIELDLPNAQIRTTNYIFFSIPISAETVPTWITPGQSSTPEWQLMHEFHHSAAGSQIDHTKWGVVADTLEPWEDFNLSDETKAQLATRIRSLMNDGLDVKAIRVYMLRIDAILRYELQVPDSTLTTQEIDTIFDEEIVKSIYP